MIGYLPACCQSSLLNVFCRLTLWKIAGIVERIASNAHVVRQHLSNSISRRLPACISFEQTTSLSFDFLQIPYISVHVGIRLRSASLAGLFFLLWKILRSSTPLIGYQSLYRSFRISTI